MGSFPARITRQDFVTPPEFASLQLASEESGRIGGARLTLADRAGKTSVTDAYEQVPIRAIPLCFGAQEPALVFFVNMTAGLLDGDAHQFDITMQPNAKALITGQSASRLHPCLHGFCAQHWRISVAEGATLVVIPGPNIPFAGTRYYQRITIDLAATARLIWADVWFAGRYARGQAAERYRFDTIVQDMTVRREQALVYRDRFVWRGPWDASAAHWHLRHQAATGSIFATHPNESLASASFADCRCASFTTAADDSIIRVVGASEKVVRTVFGCCMRMALSAAEGPCTRPWFDNDGRLASVHWFS